MIAFIRSLSVTGGLGLAIASSAFRLARSRASSRLAISLIDLSPVWRARQNPQRVRKRGGPRAQISLLHLSRCPPIAVPRFFVQAEWLSPNHCLVLNRSHRTRNRSGESRVQTNLAQYIRWQSNQCPSAASPPIEPSLAPKRSHAGER